MVKALAVKVNRIQKEEWEKGERKGAGERKRGRERDGEKREVEKREGCFCCEQAMGEIPCDFCGRLRSAFVYVIEYL